METFVVSGRFVEATLDFIARKAKARSSQSWGSALARAPVGGLASWWDGRAVG
jgi:hypothetical protein